MEEWLQLVLRQCILYSLPVVISLSLVGLAEAKMRPESRVSHPPFYALMWHGAWLPAIAAIAFHRAFIIALPRPLGEGVRPALIRMLAHTVLCAAGWLLYVLSLQHQAPAGLPSVHHWWTKVLMFYNLCMLGLHLLPLPGMFIGECLLTSAYGRSLKRYATPIMVVGILVVLAASPMLDLTVFRLLISPIYDLLANLAAGF